MATGRQHSATKAFIFSAKDQMKSLPLNPHSCLVDALRQSTQHGFLSTVTATILNLHLQGTGARLLWNVFEWVPLWLPLKVLLN